jgi:hypothetical protein
MKAYVLDDLPGKTILHEGHFTWEITNYNKLPHRNHGPEFQVGGYNWFPRSLTQLTTGASSSSLGETTKKNVHQLTSKQPLLPILHPKGTYAPNSQSACGIPPTKRAFVF